MFSKKIDMRYWIRHLSVVAVILLSCTSISVFSAAQKIESNKDSTLKKSRALKENSAQINADLIDLERQILFPKDTQVAVFVAMDEGSFFQLKSVDVMVNGQVMTSHQYSEKQVYSLQMGGKHRIYMGNYSPGNYEFKAIVRGIGPHGRPYRRTAAFEVKKASAKQVYLELNVIDGSDLYRPDFELTEWK